MSEKEHINIDKEKVEISVEKHENNAERLSINHETEKAISERNAETARANIDDLAKNKEEVIVTGDLSSDKKDADMRWTSKELLTQTYQRSLASIQNRLSRPEKTFSKTIHNPLVEKTSELASTTIARPIGILFGSIFSFIGSLGGYLVVKRLGGELPYSIFAFLFVGGFALGLLLEILLLIYKKRKLK